MSTANLTTNDMQIRDNVLWQLEWDPAVDAAAIGVAVVDATVTLTGYIDTYAGKLAAERSAKHIRGVRAVANDLVVRPTVERTDTDIASDIVHALRLHGHVPQSVQASVRHAHVVLTGRVDYLFQKLAAEDAIRHIRGVRHVDNHVEMAAKGAAHDVRKHILKALHQNASVDAGHILVTVDGSVATLTGTVGSLVQREAAEWAALQTPGVADVNDRLVVVNRAIPAAVDHTLDPEC